MACVCSRCRRQGGQEPELHRPRLSLCSPGGHLLTDKEYSDYKLTVEYRFSDKPGNCGVLVHAPDLRALYEMSPKSMEVQIINKSAGDFWCIQENIEVPDMEKRR
mgnify:CR=1 FL=1